VRAIDREKFVELCKGQPAFELLGSLIRGILAPAPGNIFVKGDNTGYIAITQIIVTNNPTVNVLDACGAAAPKGGIVLNHLPMTLFA
jgi:hypothetical protein